MSISSILARSNPYEQFVQQLVQLESRTKFQLLARQSAEKERQTALNDVSKAITNFVSKTEGLRDEEKNAFEPFSTTIGDNTIAKVSSLNTATRSANYNLTVQRLASKDITLSNTLAKDGTTLSGTGTGSIEITIGEQTELIELDTTGLTDQEVLQQLAAQVNERFGEAANASVFGVTDTESQFSIKSNETGFANRVQIANASGDLATLALNSLNPQEELDAQFTIDGVNFVRGSNEITDAVEGLSITLLKTSETSTEINISRDINKARGNVQEFVTAYNNMNRTIRDRTFIDAENDRRGALQNIRSIRNFTINLRQTGLLNNNNTQDGAISRLSDVGIEFERDGTMVVRDSLKLEEALAQNPDGMRDLFTGEGSPVTQMYNQAQEYSRAKTGILAAVSEGLESRIESLDRQIERQDKYLAQYEERQRDQFIQLQLIIDRGTQQFNDIVAMQSRMF